MNDRFPGISREQVWQVEGLWQGHVIPNWYERSEQATLFDQARLKQILRDYLDQRLKLDPHLSEVRRKLEEIQQGKPFLMEPVWLHESDTGISLQEFVKKRPLGSLTSEATQRWRENFQSKAAKRLLSKPGMEAFANNYNQFVSQQEAGKPRPPNLRDPKRSEQQMREALVEHVMSFVKHKIGVFVSKEDFQNNRGVLVNLFAIFKPEDWDHINPRWVLNLVKVNEPIQKVHKARKFGGGAQTARQLIQQDDLGFATDLEKGYNQVAQCPKMAKFQRYLVQCSVVQEATRKLSTEIPEGAAIYYHNKEPCYILEPRCLQFGHTLSRELFQKRVQLVTSELSQLARIRSITQVDDVLVLNKRGPAASYVDLLITIATFEHYRFQVHLSQKKAAQLWPASSFTFDGSLHVPNLMQFFPIEEQVARHQKELRPVLEDLRKERPKTTLLEYARISMQQFFHKRHHWPTALLMPHPLQHLGKEQRRLRKIHGPDAMWKQRIEKPSQATIEAFQQLLEHKDVGEYFRATGNTVATVTYDASTNLVGFEVTDHRSGKKTTGSIAMVREEREKHHTPQELQAGVTVVLGQIQDMDLRGADQANPDVIKVYNDNTAAVKNLQSPGGKASMVDPQIELRNEMRRRNLVLVSGYANKYYMDVISQVDWNSRRSLTYPEWQLNPEVLSKALELLQKEITLDLMASRTTAQTEKYLSRHPEPEATGSDALSINWAKDGRLQGHKLYCFPPPLLIDRVVTKLLKDPVEMILVFPLWQNLPPSWPDLRELIQEVVLIPPTTDLYKHPLGKSIPTQEVPSWPLILAHLSKKPLESKLPTSSISIGRKVLRMTNSRTFLASWSLSTIDQAAKKILGGGQHSSTPT